jgi:hypothetical protein
VLAQLEAERVDGRGLRDWVRQKRRETLKRKKRKGPAGQGIDDERLCWGDFDLDVGELFASGYAVTVGLDQQCLPIPGTNSTLRVVDFAGQVWPCEEQLFFGAVFVAVAILRFCLRLPSIGALRVSLVW